MIEFKGNKHKCNFHYAAMLMMTSHILKSVDFTEIEKSIYLESKSLSVLQIKTFICNALRDFIPFVQFKTRLCKLYVLVVRRTRFRVNPHSIVVWTSTKSLLEAGAKSEV